MGSTGTIVGLRETEASDFKGAFSQGTRQKLWLEEAHLSILDSEASIPYFGVTHQRIEPFTTEHHAVNPRFPKLRLCKDSMFLSSKRKVSASG